MNDDSVTEVVDITTDSDVFIYSILFQLFVLVKLELF